VPAIYMLVGSTHHAEAREEVEDEEVPGVPEAATA